MAHRQHLPKHIQHQIAKQLSGGLQQPSGGFHSGEQGKQYVYDWFVYSTGNLGNLNFNGSPINNNIQIEADADFELMKLTYYATLHGKTPPFSTSDIPELTLQIVDSGAGRQLFNQAIPFESIAGKEAGLPFILPQPRLFTAKSTIQITVASISAASQYDNIFVNLIGRKVFEYN